MDDSDFIDVRCGITTPMTRQRDFDLTKEDHARGRIANSDGRASAILGGGRVQQPSVFLYQGAPMKASSLIVAGSFCGGAIEGGTFHLFATPAEPAPPPVPDTEADIPSGMFGRSTDGTAAPEEVLLDPA